MDSRRGPPPREGLEYGGLKGDDAYASSWSSISSTVTRNITSMPSSSSSSSESSTSSSSQSSSSSAMASSKASISSSEARRTVKAAEPSHRGWPSLVKDLRSSRKSSLMKSSRACSSSALVMAIALPAISRVNMGISFSEWRRGSRHQRRYRPFRSIVAGPSAARRFFIGHRPP
ncbi:hypothetical protein C4E04_15110 [Microvirga sp. 17 mud 1-3]|nr:hypothetical protein C4E04_15110 [Microvirga sp. 17 mud 1-3]